MKFFADENMPTEAILELRGRGFDVSAVKERIPGAGDPDIFQVTVAEEMILLTQDKDFGELAYRAGLPGSAGVVLFRLSGRPSEMIKRMVNVLTQPHNWAGSFSVVDDARIRMRPLPQQPTR